MLFHRIPFAQQFLAQGEEEQFLAQGEEDDRINLSDDKELLDALEIFQGMSPEEMEETILDLMEQMGDDDPESKAVLVSLLNDLLPDLKSQSNLKEMAEDDEVAAATQEALRLLSGSNWDDLWEKQEFILEGVLASGQLHPDDEALYKSDPTAWKEQLRLIWDELQKQAAETEL